MNPIPPAFAALIAENTPGMQHPKVLNDGRWACVVPLLFHAAVKIGTPEEMLGGFFSDGYCFRNVALATKALDEWDGFGEPKGWHRHPNTGRRRTDGDPIAEYIRG